MRAPGTAANYRVIVASFCIRGRYGRRTAGELLSLSWVRPVLEGGRAVLLVETLDDGPGWRVAPREVVKQR